MVLYFKVCLLGFGHFLCFITVTNHPHQYKIPESRMNASFLGLLFSILPVLGFIWGLWGDKVQEQKILKVWIHIELWILHQ